MILYLLLNFLICLSIHFPVYSTHAAEVDGFTNRDMPLSDSTAKVNAYINQQIMAALNNPALYQESRYVTMSGGVMHMGYTETIPVKGCNKNRLLSLLQHSLNTNWPEVREQILRDKTIQTNRIRRTNKSIYRDLTIRIPSMSLGACCDPVINLGGKRVGVDKVDHFLGHGFVYYKNVQTTKRVSSALAIGLRRESSAFGLGSTGVKSYGDLAANYQGYLFWKKLLDGPDALIQCKDDRYFLNQKADISPHVDDAWDETINCSSYSAQDVANAVENQIKKVSNGKTCPLEPEKCVGLKTRYGSYVKEILHPKCINPDSTLSVESRKTRFETFIDAVQEAF